MDERAQNGQKFKNLKTNAQIWMVFVVSGCLCLVYNYFDKMGACEVPYGKHTRIHLPARFPHQDACAAVYYYSTS